MGPLENVRIVDLSTVIMGPLAARILGDMGADVIKVEPPGGDHIRAIGPMRNPGMGPFYMNANRNKRSIALDAKADAGRAVLEALIRSADVLLYNIRPNAMARLGLDYAACRALKPDLIYCGAYGFGQDGPYAAKPAYDDLIQGLCAIPSLIAESSKGPPRYVPLAMVDRYVGVSAANAVLGALVHRMKTGEGQSIEVPMFETMAECVLGDHSGGQMFDPAIGPAGYPRSLAPERHPYATRDGFICIVVWTDRHWASFLRLVGKPGLIDDPRFASLTSRTRHASEIHAMLEAELRARTASEWLEAFESEDIPAMPLHTLDSLVRDPHLNATGYFTWEEHPSEGRIRSMRPAASLPASPLSVRRPAPKVGQHSLEILEELGYTSADAAALVEAGVVRSG